MSCYGISASNILTQKTKLTSLSCVTMPKTMTSPSLAVLPKSASTVFSYRANKKTNHFDRNLAVCVLVCVEFPLFLLILANDP